MHISNFRPVKRVADVLEIFAQVQEQVPAKLPLVGKGRSFRKSNAGSMSWDSAAKVHFLGKQDEIAHVISMADVLPLPRKKALGWSLWKRWPAECLPSAPRQAGFPS